MFPARALAIPVLVAGLYAAEGSVLWAGEPPADVEAVLTHRGLKKAGDLWVLKAESEVRTKLDEARRLAGRLNQALVQQRGTLDGKEHQATLKEVNAQIGRLRSELNATNQQMRQLPRSHYGRMRRGFANNLVAEQYAELTAYRNQVQAEVDQATAFLRQLKSPAFDPKVRKEIDAEVRERREALHQALLETRRLVEATRAQYEALGQDPGIKKVKENFGRSGGTPLKFGPSRDFLGHVRLLDRLERVESPDQTAGPAAQPARKSQGLSKGRRASQPRGTAEAGEAGSPFAGEGGPADRTERRVPKG